MDAGEETYEQTGRDRLNLLYPWNKVISSLDGLLKSFRTETLDLDHENPFQIGEELEVSNLQADQLQKVRNSFETDSVSNYKLNKFLHHELDTGKSEEWIEQLGLGNIEGLDRRFRKPLDHSGDYKVGYVDEHKDYFLQVPKKGETFSEKFERVKTWKENKKTLNQAQKYIDEVLQESGRKTVFRNNVPLEIDYDYLRNRERVLRDEIEDGITTPSEDYNIIVTECDGQPLPVMIGEFNTSMIEDQSELEDLDNYEEIIERQKVVAMYMDSMIDQGLFENALEEYWYGRTNGREGIKNMFYDVEDDSVGIVDLGEKRGDASPNRTPEVELPSKYT
jgi:hypothetical protein